MLRCVARAASSSNLICSTCEYGLSVIVWSDNKESVLGACSRRRCREGSRRREIECISFTSVIPTLERSLRDTASWAVAVELVEYRDFIKSPYLGDR